ncbi:MAG TPA: lysine--tRNA ligase [Candidatus Eisenbacteria bacterium]|jgi:lysyl-tRNA synthetase class 2|nr:lysine--tRNA ligase [Candidatus Eisenbacteria bacterium]
MTTPAEGGILKDPNELVKERLKKYEAIKKMGIDPYEGGFKKPEPIAAVVAGFEENKPARTAGRLTAMRVMGKTTFCDLRDESGRIQLFVKGENLGGSLELFQSLDIGDILGVGGELFKTKTGEISIRVHELRLLAKSLRPMPEKWHGLKDVEIRYRQRYLDLISNEEARDIFRKRSLVVRSIRKTLDDKGYLEVETPMMHPIPGGAAGKPFKTHHEALGVDLFLRVAPELYLKKLLVGGFDKVYEINKSFRNEGISTRHNPEFTMLEVYTAYHDVNDVMDLCEEIVKNAAREACGATVLEFADGKLNLDAWRRVSFAGLMNDGFGIRPEDDIPVWVEKLKKKGVDVGGKDLSRTQIINIVADLLETEVKGAPGELAPVFVTDYFAEISPLARRSKKNPLLSDRFELYVGGMEVANGYSEQNDPVEQRERLVEELKEKGKSAEGGLDEDFLQALEHGMPPAGGLGIGIDRLVMLLTHQPTIREVILFPQMKPEKTA